MLPGCRAPAFVIRGVVRLAGILGNHLKPVNGLAVFETLRTSHPQVTETKVK
jgi:hypothetical protein